MADFTEEELKRLGLSIEEDDAEDLVQKFGIPVENLDERSSPTETETVSETPAKPKFDSTTLQGLPFEEGMRRYAEILKDPNVTPPTAGGLGYAVYTDPTTGEKQYIAPPDISAFRPVEGIISLFTEGPKQAFIDTFEPRTTVDSMDLAAIGAAESAGDLAELGAAGVDKIAGTNLSETVDKATPSIDTSRDLSDALIADGVPALVGGVLAGAGVKTLAGGISVAKDAPTVVKLGTDLLKAVGITLGAEAGATATVGTDEGTIFMGENAALPILTGVDLGDSRADAVIEQRLNTLTEGMFLGSTIAGVAAGSKAVGDFAVQMTVAPIVTVLKGEKAMERRMYDEIMSKLVNITDASSPAEIDAARREIARVVSENKDLFVKSMTDSTEKQVTVDTVTALLRGIDDPEIYNRAVGIRAGQMGRGAMSPQLNAALQRPKEELASETEDFLRSVGGETPADQTATMAGAAEELAGQGRQYVDDLGGALSKAQADYATSVTKILDGYAQDVEFGQKIMDLENKVGTEIVTPRGSSLENIQKGLQTAYETMNAEKDALYAAVSGGTIDVEKLLQPLDEIADIEGISKSGVAVKSNSPLRNILNLTRRQEVADVDAAGNQVFRPETDEERIQRVTEAFAKNGIDFGFLYRQIRPELSMVASNLYDAKLPAAGQQVRDLVHFIDGPMVESLEATDPAVAEAATKALTYYRDEYAPIWRSQGKMQDFADLYDRTLGRTSSANMMGLVTGNGFAQRGFDEQVFDLTNNLLTKATPPEIRNLAEVLNAQRPGSAEDIADFMIFDALEKIAPAVKSTNLEDLDLNALSTSLRQQALALREVFPQKADSLDNFIRQIEAAGTDKARLKTIVEQSAERAKVAKDEVMQSELRFFLNDHPWAGMSTTSNPYEAFGQVFRSKEGTAMVTNLMDAANALPAGRKEAVIDGMETAYLKYMRDNLFGARIESGGQPAMKTGRVNKSTEELLNDLSIGRAIFRDRPEVMDTMQALMEAANFIDRTKAATPIASMSPTAFNQEAMRSVQRSIYMTLGPLNRLATQVRSLSGMVFDKLDANGKAQVMMDRLFADPDYFMSLARRFGDTPDNEYYAKAFMDYIVGQDNRGIGRAVIDTTTGLQSRDPVNQSLLQRGAVSGYLKTEQEGSEDEADALSMGRTAVDTALPDFLTPDALQGELDAAGQAVDAIRGAAEEEWMR